MAGLHAAPQFKRFERWQSLRKEPCLHLLRDVQFLGHASFSLQLLRRRTALRFDLANEIIFSHERKGVSIQVFKPGENPAPKCSLRRVMKANPAPLPLIELGHDVFRNQHSIPAMANQLVFFGLALGRNQGENRVAVRRRKSRDDQIQCTLQK